ncbi:hypothetical protein [Acinetobacter baumannii]|uniref:hypothetical protein n=1 Tax=Acinetobacter baumannii TaxID=470 RepID=UPI002FE35ADA
MTAAKTEQTKADTAKTIASMENEQRDSVVNAIEKINQNMASAQPMSEGVANV